VGAVRGIALLSDIPDRQSGDGRPQRVIRGEDAVIPVPMLPRRRDEIRKPVQELKRREFDDAVGPRPRRLAAAAWPDPVGRFVSGQHVTDTGDPAIGVANHGEPFECERRPGAIPQEMLERLKVVRHVAVDERDPHTRIDGKPAVLPGEHVGGGRGVEQACTSEPPDHAAADPLGECGQIGRGDWSRRRLSSAGGFAFAPPAERSRRGVTRRCGVCRRHKDTVGHACVEVHVMVERRAEAVQEGDGAESRAGGCRRVGVPRHACGRTQKSLDLCDEDLREG
jgi:hypothetical protein